jgi:hypothetical protein
MACLRPQSKKKMAGKEKRSNERIYLLTKALTFRLERKEPMKDKMVGTRITSEMFDSLQEVMRQEETMTDLLTAMLTEGIAKRQAATALDRELSEIALSNRSPEEKREARKDAANRFSNSNREEYRLISARHKDVIQGMTCMAM